MQLQHLHCTVPTHFVIVCLSARLGQICHCHCVPFGTSWPDLSLSLRAFRHVLARYVIVIACLLARLGQVCHCHPGMQPLAGDSCPCAGLLLPVRAVARAVIAGSSCYCRSPPQRDTRQRRHAQPWAPAHAGMWPPSGKNPIAAPRCTGPLVKDP